jgi:hypothetical protein
MADVTVLFDRYTSGYNVAESYYSSSPYLSWMDVIVGDPKFRLTSARLPSDYDPSIYNGGSNALPVEMSLFTAAQNGSKVELAWQTASEKNNYGFEVERKMLQDPAVTPGPGSWQREGFVNGNGTSNSPRRYSFAENVATSGRYAFRLKQIDRDGTFTYSHEVHVDVGLAPRIFSLSQNYPNPFNPTTTIEFTLSKDGHAVLEIYDVVGRKVATLFDDVAKAGEYHRAVFDGSRFSSGVYFYRIQAGNLITTRRLVLLK